MQGKDLVQVKKGKEAGAQLQRCMMGQMRTVLMILGARKVKSHSGSEEFLQPTPLHSDKNVKDEGIAQDAGGSRVQPVIWLNR